jgi:hypothetical protein
MKIKADLDQWAEKPKQQHKYRWPDVPRYTTRKIKKTHLKLEKESVR